MESKSEPDREEPPVAALPPIPLGRFAREIGISRRRCWLFRKKGWLETVVIGSHHYVTREAIGRFNKRAASGEFAGAVKKPIGRRRKQSATDEADGMV